MYFLSSGEYPALVCVCAGRERGQRKNYGPVAGQTGFRYFFADHMFYLVLLFFRLVIWLVAHRPETMRPVGKSCFILMVTVWLTACSQRFHLPMRIQSPTSAK